MKKLLLLLLISGCLALPPLPQMPAKQLNSWQINGRIAIKTKNDSWTAKFNWQQQIATYKLRFSNPMGQGAILLDGSDSGVIMRTADNKVFNAKDPDTLMADVLKLYIPVTNLNFWIRGIPTPNSSPQWYSLDKIGRLQTLRQDAWEISYGRYTNIENINLPKKIFLDNDEFQVKIIVDKWRI
ncbi:lipoprotein insertase outer membrane protein LolB [Thiotrichales bacterium HSG1]|nr:lipoprotein insertase outer membrane protein LolB [Thiotrichales bacterium HSG1]